jgi:hypothetical protein
MWSLALTRRLLAVTRRVSLGTEVAMLPSLPTSSARYDTIAGLWTNGPALRDQSLLYLVLAALFLVIALRFMRRALAPIGTFVQAVAAAAVVAFAIGMALVLLAAAALNPR